MSIIAKCLSRIRSKLCERACNFTDGLSEWRVYVYPKRTLTPRQRGEVLDTVRKFYNPLSKGFNHGLDAALRSMDAFIVKVGR